MASSTDIKSGPPASATDLKPASERRGSIVVDTELAGEEDAAVLAKMGSVSPLKNHPMQLLMNTIQVQTRTATKLQHARGLWDRLFHHGSPAIYRKYPRVLDSRRSSRPRLGLVPGFWLYLYRRASHERSRFQ